MREKHRKTTENEKKKWKCEFTKHETKQERAAAMVVVLCGGGHCNLLDYLWQARAGAVKKVSVGTRTVCALYENEFEFFCLRKRKNRPVTNGFLFFRISIFALCHAADNAWHYERVWCALANSSAASRRIHKMKSYVSWATRRFFHFSFSDANFRVKMTRSK